MDEINSLWLPLIVYVNTDQQLTTRLGWVNEWTKEQTIKQTTTKGAKDEKTCKTHQQKRTNSTSKQTEAETNKHTNENIIEQGSKYTIKVKTMKQR